MKITDDIDIIEYYLRSLISEYGVKDGDWLDDNTIEIKTGKKKEVLGKVKIEHDKIEVTGDALENFFAKLLKKKEDKEKKKITEEIAKTTIFKKILTQTSYFNGLEQNYGLFKDLDEMFGEIGVKDFTVKEVLKTDNSCKKELTICADPEIYSDIGENFDDGYTTRLKDFILENFAKKANKMGFTISTVSERRSMYALDTEKVEKIEFKGMLLGKYYRERNIIQLNFNPFLVKKFTKMSDDLPEIFYKLHELISELKPETVDAKAFTKKQFIISFIKGSVDSLREQRDRLKKIYKTEEDYIAMMRETVVKRLNTEREIEYIEKNIKLGGEGLMEELTLTEKLPFIEKVELDTSGIIMKYKPTCLKINELDMENGYKFGKRTFYLGSLTFKITPREIKVKGEIKGISHCHPHSQGGSDYASCCFGDGSSDGRKKLFEMLAMNKFSEVAKMLWFWIKTYISGSAYSHHPTFYGDLLRAGVPIWDEKGERIKSKEQREDWTEYDCYKGNIKKYADIQIC